MWAIVFTHAFQPPPGAADAGRAQVVREQQRNLRTVSWAISINSAAALFTLQLFDYVARIFAIDPSCAPIQAAR
jgi:hypothetical protein